MVSFTLKCGAVTVVDEEDVHLLERWTWRLNNTGYVSRNSAYRDETGKRRQKTILLHRIINDTPPEMVTDHIDRDRKNNTRINLRACTPSQNQWNRTGLKPNRTGYKGVYAGRNGKWVCQLRYLGKTRHVGVSDTREEAHEAYRRKVIEVRGPITWHD